MKVGDLVILEIRGEEWERCESDGKKIGIVKTILPHGNELAKVLWSCGDETWCLQEQLLAVKKCP